MQPAQLSAKDKSVRDQSKRKVKAKAAAKKTATERINLRIDEETRSLIDRARQVSGQTRTDFMLGSARVKAQEILLDQLHLTLSDEDWKNFEAALDAPTKTNKELVALMKSKAPWDN